MGERQYEVVVGSGDLRPEASGGVSFEHQWTNGGVVYVGSFTGAHLLHLAVAGCVLNDVHREAQRVGMDVDGVRVVAWGQFDTQTWKSAGIDYVVEVSSTAESREVDELLRVVDAVAEIPKVVQQEVRVRRQPAPGP